MLDRLKALDEKDVERIKEAFVEARAVQAMAGWKCDDKTKRYICRERECQNFCGMVELPEEIKTDKVEAELKDGISDVVLPKKARRHKKKVAVK